MRLRFKSIELVGPRTVRYEFEPGLNLIVGPMETGKTSLWRLMKFLLGTHRPEDNPPEVSQFVGAVSGQFEIGHRDVSVIRPYTSTDTALVEVRSNTDFALLPARRATPASPQTYASWMLKELG